MSQFMYIPSNHTPRIGDGQLKKDWNEFPHPSTQGRYIKPRIFSGFQKQRIKLTTVTKQSHTPKLSPIRHNEDLSHHTTLFIQGVNDSSLQVDTRLRFNKNSQSSQIKLHRNPALFFMLPSGTLTKSIKDNNRNRFDQKPQNTFRASSIYIDVSATP